MVAVQQNSRYPSTPPIKTPQELVHIKHKITLRQYKYWVLILKSYREVYEKGENVEGFSYIPMTRLAEYLGYEPNKSELRADLEALRKEAIIYNVLGKDGKPAQRGAGFISEWEVSSNWVGYKLPHFLREIVERLDLKSAIFQQINWSIFNSFSGKYEAILYKLCKDYVGVQQTPYMTIELFREYMGLQQNEYAEYKDLNKFVITGPVRKINASELSDIEISVETTKNGRRVVGLRFHVQPKRQMSLALNIGSDPAFEAARVTIPVSLQRKYLQEKEPSEIALAIQRANQYADEQQRKGKAVNLGAIYQTAINQGWGLELKEQLEAEERQKKVRAVKEEPRKDAEEGVVERQRRERKEYARQRFEQLDGAKQKELIEQFGQQLNGFLLSTFRKHSIKSPLIANMFMGWLADRLG